jgi:hypothetical protein
MHDMSLLELVQLLAELKDQSSYISRRENMKVAQGAAQQNPGTATGAFWRVPEGRVEAFIRTVSCLCDCPVQLPHSCTSAAMLPSS